MNNRQQLAPQEETRIPRINPHVYGAINTIDRFVGSAPLSRLEHAEAGQCMNLIMQHMELLEDKVKALNAELETLRNRPPTSNTKPTDNKAADVVLEATSKAFQERPKKA